ncbi:MAG: hypothetical protein AMS24_00185 [Chlamydiae bacterium SM23_39]|nr:MAG: hypothetical protein AMS24_00185 [Chlamydiae bacterium SM23_39]
MKKLFFLSIFFVSSFVQGGCRDVFHEYLQPICDLYHNTKHDYYLALPKPLSDWQIYDDQKKDEIVVSYKNIPFFSVLAIEGKNDIDCTKHYRYKSKLLEIAKSIAQNAKKGLQIEKAVFKKNLEELDIYYIFIEGNVNGKKSYHFITSLDYQWFDFFTDVDEKYNECLEEKLDKFFMDLIKNFDEEEDEDEYEEDEAYDAANFLFEMFAIDLYTKNSF